MAVGRLMVNVGSHEDPEWKFANPKPGENDGSGVLKMQTDGGAWVPVADLPGKLKINVADPGDPPDWSGKGWQ